MKNILFIIMLLSIYSCSNKNRKTTLDIIDNNRHYYPIIQGQKLDIVVKIVNTGKNPFELKELFTSCGCVTIEKSSIQTIMPGKEGVLLLKYDSNKNIGLVEHFITLYGNLEKEEKKEIKFSVNVVPDALYTKDYEEIFYEEQTKSGGIKSAVDGSTNNKGYYID